MSQPDRPYSNEQISIIEDLDPEPDRGRGVGNRRDIVLGILLLFAVFVFAGWQWWRGEYQAGQYHAGLDAADRNDWESALRYYSEASGYSNADSLARDAQEQIAERDRLYKSASEYAAKEAWMLALRDIRGADAIQPDYLDLEQKEDTALQHVYTQALSGTVAMREGADPAGLYYRAADNWVLLKESDLHSNLLARDAEGNIVYDVPGASQPERPIPPPGSLYNPGGLFRDRKLISARPSTDGLEFTPLDIDASYFVPIISGHAGLWLAHPNDFIPNDHHTEAIVRNPFTIGSGTLAYQPYSSALSSTVQIAPGTEIATGKTLVAIDPDSNRYLLAEWSGADADGAGRNAVIKLYLCAAGETGRQLVYTHTGGGLQSAALSPDGRFVVIHTYTRTDDPDKEEQGTVLVDLKDPTRTANLITLQVSTAGKPGAVMTSAFIRRGALAGDLVLSLIVGGRTHIQLLNPLGEAATVNDLLTDVRIEGTQRKGWEVIDLGAEGALVLGQDTATAGPPLTSTLTMIEFSAKGESTIHAVDVSSYSGVIDAMVGENSLLWTNYEYKSDTKMRRPVRSVYSLPTGIPGYGQVGRLLFTTANIPDAYLRPDPSFFLGTRLLAYTTGDELHARTYDGTLDLVLEKGVATISENAAIDFYTRQMK